MKKQIARKYNISDAGFIEHSRTETGNLETNVDDFTAVDSSVDQIFVNGLKSDINNAEAIESDEVTSDKQMQLTNLVKEKMTECMDHFSVIKYFAKKAYRDNQAVRNEFGEDDYAEKKTKQSEMVKFMKNLSVKVTEYRQQLLDASAVEEQLDSTQTLYEELVQVSSDQDHFISNRPVKTRNRIIALNTVYDKLSLVNELAKIIYKDNFQMLKLFLMPHGSASKKESSIIVAAENSIVLFEEGIIEGTFIKVENTGGSNLKIAVSETHNEIAHENAYTLEAGKEEILKADDIMNGTAGMLIAYNETPEEGKVKASQLK